MVVKQIVATELQTKLKANDGVFLLDVREPDEFRYAHIDTSVSIPLQQLPHRIAELHMTDDIVVICHHGVRSQQAAQFLVHSGFSQVANLVGGIDAWSCLCDSSVRRY